MNLHTICTWYIVCGTHDNQQFEKYGNNNNLKIYLYIYTYPNQNSFKNLASLNRNEFFEEQNSCANFLWLGRI